MTSTEGVGIPLTKAKWANPFEIITPSEEDFI